MNFFLKKILWIFFIFNNHALSEDHKNLKKESKKKIYKVINHRVVSLEEELKDQETSSKKNQSYKIYREGLLDPKEEQNLKKVREQKEEQKSKIIKKESVFLIPEQKIRGRALVPSAPFVLPEKPKP